MKDTLGRWLYPHIHPVVRARKMRALGYGLALGSVASVLFAGLLWVLNRPSTTESHQLSPSVEKTVGARSLKR